MYAYFLPKFVQEINSLGAKGQL